MNTIVYLRIRLHNATDWLQILLFAITLIMCGCSSKGEKSYYFFFGNHLKKSVNNQHILYSYRYVAEEEDLEFGRITVTYSLVHTLGFDTTFKVPADFLNQHEVFDDHWFSDIKRVSSFWNRHWGFSTDSLRIFMGELTPAGDSVVFYRVGRTWRPYM